MMSYLYELDVVIGEVRDSESKRNKVKTEAMATLNIEGRSCEPKDAMPLKRLRKAEEARSVLESPGGPQFSRC